jgi:GNAT superfamily N-acetyltransferase
MMTASADRIAVLAEADLPRVLELAHLAGWNQTLPDLQRMLTFAPESCFGLWKDGVLVSTGMAFPYGRDLGWVAMVLTHPDERGKGYGRRLTEQAMDWLRGQQTAWMKLDASPLGQPIYERLGFKVESWMERRTRLPGVSVPSPALPSANPDDCALPLALDRAGFGADRSRLLTLQLRIPNVKVAVLPDDGGFALLRPGLKAWQLGPMVCRDADRAEQLVRWAIHVQPEQPLQWDLNSANRHARRLADQYGFEAGRVLARMAMPGVADPPPCQGDDQLVYGIGGFDFG